ncbi:MAG: DUF309 domain-containing protein [Candidatus Promineifilaceae bacterium]|nr:DUF309 domain-containing protein [Candidatus Promineifilaceae bacterium]
MNTNFQSPLVVAFVADLMFTTRISSTIHYLGWRIHWIEDKSDLGAYSAAPKVGFSEQLEGQLGELFLRLAEWQPALLLFDLANEAIPWQEWIAALKSSPATRRIPVMTYGPHTNVALMESAKKVGADLVLARSRFTADMPKLFQKHARIPDSASIKDTCQEPLSALAVSGIEKFNRGQYYACHDDLEEAWRNDDSPGRDLYRGILQVGIAYYQIERGNYRGAMKMLLRLRQWLEPLSPVCRGVNVAQLMQDADAVQTALVALGPEQIGSFDRSLFKTVEYAQN